MLNFEFLKHNSWESLRICLKSRWSRKSRIVYSEPQIYRTMLRKTTMKIHFKVTEDPMSFQNLLARRRTQKTFSKLEVFTWIRSFNVLLMKHWGLCTPRFVEIPSVELLNISLKSEFKNCLHWSWNRVGLCFKRQQGKKAKYFKVKTMWLRKCGAKKSLVLMLDRLSFLWDWYLWKNIMYVEIHVQFWWHFVLQRTFCSKLLGI